MGYQYNYLLMGLIFFVIWLGLFFWRKNTRKQMLVMSPLFALFGPFMELVYTQDWWGPLTLNGAAVGIESLLVGFSIGGIASVVYEDVFKKKVRVRKVSEAKEIKRNLNLTFIVVLAFLIFFMSFYLFKFNSLISTILASIVTISVMWLKRPDLILDSLATGIILVLVAAGTYGIIETLTPGWISATWYFNNVPEIIIFNITIDEIIWYFLAGLFAGQLYEYWQEGRIVDS